MLVRAVVATDASDAAAPPPEGATPAVTSSFSLIDGAAVAPALMGTAPVLRVLTPVDRVVVVVQWETSMGLAGPRALESRITISSKGPVEKGGTRRRSSREATQIGNGLP